MSNIEDKARQFQDQATDAVNKVADKVDAKAEPFLKKYGKWIAIGIAVLGVLLLLTRGF